MEIHQRNETDFRSAVFLISATNYAQAIGENCLGIPGKAGC